MTADWRINAIEKPRDWDIISRTSVPPSGPTSVSSLKSASDVQAVMSANEAKIAARAAHSGAL